MHRVPRTLDEVVQDGHSIIAVCRDATCRHARYVDLSKLIGRLGGRTPLLPQPDQQHYSDRMRCPSCKAKGMFVWWQPKLEKPRAPERPNYQIIDCGAVHPFERFDVIATAANLMVAKGGYIAAALFYKTHRITLQQGTFVISDSKRDGIPNQLTAEDYDNMRRIEWQLNSGDLEAKIRAG